MLVKIISLFLFILFSCCLYASILDKNITLICLYAGVCASCIGLYESPDLLSKNLKRDVKDIPSYVAMIKIDAKRKFSFLCFKLSKILVCFSIAIFFVNMF